MAHGGRYIIEKPGAEPKRVEGDAAHVYHDAETTKPNPPADKSPPAQSSAKGGAP